MLKRAKQLLLTPDSQGTHRDSLLKSNSNGALMLNTSVRPKYTSKSALINSSHFLVVATVNALTPPEGEVLATLTFIAAGDWPLVVVKHRIPF
jgi:hypothetical protein